MQPGRDYVSMHSHPSDCPFSRRDGFILFLYPRVRVVAVVGVRGTLHLLSRAAEAPAASQEELVAEHRAAHDALADEHASAVDSGRLSRRAAACWRADRVWREVAPAIGLRYTRLARSEGW